MSTYVFPREKFLDRIGLKSPPPLTVEGLRELHRAHCFALPFENIDPFLGRPVSMDPGRLAEKLLGQGRGGYCFELNSFFRLALESFGFSVRPLLARVFMGRPQSGPRTHLAHLVELEGRLWLADVGFGGPGLVDPVPFESGYRGEQAGRSIRLREDSAWGLLYEDEIDGKWRTIYALLKERVEPVDLEMGNHFCATHPDSIFRNALYIAHPRRTGRLTVWNRDCRLVEGEREENRVLRSEEDLGWLMRQIGLHLNPEELRRIQERLPALPS